MSPLIKRYCEFCEEYLRKDDVSKEADLSAFFDLFADDIDFADPVVQCVGKENTYTYYVKGLVPWDCFSMEIHQVMEQEGEAFLRWTATGRGGAFNDGKEFTFPGVTYLRFTDKIHYYRDYMDTAAMHYKPVQCRSNS